jgi:hypothetical protein
LELALEGVNLDVFVVVDGVEVCCDALVVFFAGANGPTFEYINPKTTPPMISNGIKTAKTYFNVVETPYGLEIICRIF